jgi:hypothetical protein
MNKLLGDAVMRGSGESTPPEAMGIRMMMMGGKVEPMYVENCGAVFGFSVNATLAAASVDAKEAVESPGDAVSAWERAKRVLEGENAGGFPPGFPGTLPPRPQAKKYKESVVDDIVDAALKVLPEATNLRHLADGEAVLVTIAGVDEAGEPVRLTLKATKSDIDKAASGALKPKDFKERVARRVG